MATGKVKWFKEDKGYGFIDGGKGKEYFVHIRNINGKIAPKTGSAVTFDTQLGKNGKEEAINVIVDGQLDREAPVNAVTPPGRPVNRTEMRPKGKFVPRPSEAVYKFVSRAGEKKEPNAHHERLADGRYDVAFEIIWQTVTPTAINPATSERKAPQGVPCSDNKFKGYQRSWLRMNGFLAISPFTVKGAIANGVANLLGGCYRMIDPENIGQIERKPLHSDAIPEGNHLCTGVKELCPRCSLFGTVEKDGKDAVGFRGRFKASTLVSSIALKKAAGIRDYSHFLSGQQAVQVEEWHDSTGQTVTAMELLPVAMTSNPYGKYTKPKYFNEDGTIRGAKYFPHETLNSARNIKGVDQKSVKNEHRTFAEVCSPGISFAETVGAENCSLDEIAALAILLHAPVFGHGFKLGIGKFFGLGSVRSSIAKIWVRDRSSYSWHSIPIGKDTAVNSFCQLLEPRLNGLSKAIRTIAKADFLNQLNDFKGTLPAQSSGESIGGGILAAAFTKANKNSK